MTCTKVIWKSIAGILLNSCFLLLFSFSAAGQEPPGLIIDGSITSQNDRSKLSGAKVIIKKNGSSFQNVIADSKGKFEAKLPDGAQYLVEITYPGYVTKRLSFSTKMVPPDFWEEGDFPFPFSMTLFKQMEGLDVSILNKPLAEVSFDQSARTFLYDKAYTKSVQAQVEKLQEDLEQLEKDYSKAMADGNKALSAGDYSIAKGYYQAALSIKVGDEVAEAKMAEAQKKHDKQLAEKGKEKAYETAIEAAEYAMNEEDFKTAETEFENALEAKPGDIYARDQLREIRDMMVAAAKAEQTYITAIGKADAALAVNDYITAKAEYTKAAEAKPQDKYAKDQLSHVEGLLIADAQKESDYIKAIERGESSMDANDYEAAKAAFEQASSIKPDEKFPKEQIVKIEAILAEMELKNKNYKEAIDKGDAAFAKNEFDAAKTAYEEAIDINPTQQYPKDQIAAINLKVEEMAKLSAQYNELIKDADARFENHDLIAAQSEYTKALEIRPNEAHPKARIDEIAIILEKEHKIEEDYKLAISNADNAFQGKDYNSAKFEYKAASNLKPDEAYPKDQLDKIEVFLAEAAKLEEDYVQAIAEGDAKMEAKEYELAKAGYTKASSLKPEEQYPKDQLKEIDAMLVELENLNQKYDETIATADKQFDSGELNEAKSGYEAALELKPGESYPKEKIAAIVATLAAAQKKEEEYQVLISEGDKSMGEKNYDGAKSSYASASALKPEESYPKEKIAEIDALLASMAEMQQKYDEAIAKADEAFNSNELEAALPLYEAAAGIKEDESYPISQITLIEGKLGEMKKIEEEYAAAIASAEAAEKGGDLTAALTDFKSASSIKPDEAYPKEKIATLTSLIAENEKKDAAYAEAIALADAAKDGGEYDIAMTQYQKASDVKPEEAYPKEQLKEVEGLKTAALAAIALKKKQDDDYKALISEADGLFTGLQYEDSKKKYQAALDIKPTEEYPKTRIQEIDKALAALMAEQEKNEKYAALIANADDAFGNKDWAHAKATYHEAQAVKPEESYPGTQIAAIEAAIAEEAAAASQKERDEKYASLIASGDAAFKSEEFELAKADFQQAKAIKPEETYPDEQIKAIDAAISAAAALAASNAAAAQAKERDDKYNAFIASGDEAFKSENWEGARSNYQQAKSVKPEETYPDEQLAAIDAAIAAAGALAAQQAKEAALREKEEKYAAFIASADQSFKEEDWETARSNYKQAKSVKPEETYPDEQIKAIDAAIASAGALAAQQAKEAALREKEEKYASLIASADQSFKEEDWEVARSSYKQAKSVKPEETYPDEQLAAIDAAVAAAGALAAQQAKEAALREKEEKYASLISAADKAFYADNFEDAKVNYNEAISVKPDEKYPKDQLKAIDAAIMAMEEGAQRENYEAYVSTADRAFKSKDWTSAKSNYESALSLMPNEQYPKDQIIRINEAVEKESAIALSSKQEESYRQAIGDADQLFNNEDWQASKSKYQEALSIKPEEVYPKNRIIEIDEKIALLANASAVDAEYNKLIAQADNSFDKGDYTSARSTFNKAISVKSESYPKQKVKEIDAILKAEKEALLAGQQANAQKQKEYDQYITNGDRNFSSKNYEGARSNYQNALSIKPGETYPSNKIKEINDILSKSAVAVKPTPAKKSSGMSEAEIAAMMAAWQKERDQSKVDRLNQEKEDLRVTAEERNENSEDKRLEANNELTQLEGEIAQSNKSGKDRNLEEAMLVEETRSDQQKFKEDLNKDSESKRNDLYKDIEKTEMGQKEMKEEGNELYQVNTEMMTTEKIELIRAQQNQSKNAHDGLLVAHESITELEDDIREEKSKSKDHYLDEVDRIQKDNSLVAASVRTWSDESREARSDSYEDIRELEKDIHEFQSNNAESYMTNTESYNKDVEEYADYKNKKNIQAKSTRTKAYNDITDYTDEVAEISLERNNKYAENNEKIRKEGREILDEQAQLVADADERRMKFDRDFYTGEDKPRHPELAREYSQGVTEESYEENDAYIVKRIVVTGENIDEYKKIYYKWGAVYYKKNGEPTTEVIWNSETQ